MTLHSGFKMTNIFYLNKTLVVIVFFIAQCNLLLSQGKPEKPNRLGRELGITQAKDSSEKPLPKISEYLIISSENDTTYVDTTLSIKKEYKFNYLRKDEFGLIPFSNMGQTYNSLTHNFQNTSLMPGIGARAKHYFFWEVDDVNYYRVPTPLTELFFKTAFEQGQTTDAFFTINTSPQFNFSIAYKGLRSLGKYQHILASSGNFRFTTNYQAKNERYFMKTHIVTQDLLNQENGGLQDDNVQYFETGDPEFLDRSIFTVNFENAENLLKSKRFYLDHNYYLISKTDSLSKNKLSIGHIMSFEDKYYQFDQTSSDSYFGQSNASTGLKDRSSLEYFYNQFQLNYSNNIIGNLQFNVSNSNYNYGYDKVAVLNGNTITNRLKGNVFAAGGKYLKQYRGFQLDGDFGVNLTGNLSGNFLKATASFKLNDEIAGSATLNHSSKSPNFNALLYQSNYENYIWQNNFNNTETQQLAFQLKYKSLANITVDLNTITDYVYFKKDETTLQVEPFQNNSTITYLRVKLENELKLGKFALNNTILYQNTQDNNNVLNVPDFTTRNTLYYSNHLFKKAMFLQTGVTFNYFTKYYMDAYNPLLAEFYVQTEKEYGAFPRLDFFVNAKIRQTRIYFKAEHFNSSFTGYNFYSAPNYPYRDFTVRFGLVWNFFL
ncbi:putative porin [Mariniflexile sp.]|uniref:putative porin n=1 Tax=Mariniflexile sp. TaxID=1979402 RepID=UPI003562F7BB